VNISVVLWPFPFMHFSDFGSCPRFCHWFTRISTDYIFLSWLILLLQASFIREYQCLSVAFPLTRISRSLKLPQVLPLIYTDKDRLNTFCQYWFYYYEPAFISKYQCLSVAFSFYAHQRSLKLSGLLPLIYTH